MARDFETGSFHVTLSDRLDKFESISNYQFFE